MTNSFYSQSDLLNNHLNRILPSIIWTIKNIHLITNQKWICLFLLLSRFCKDFQNSFQTISSFFLTIKTFFFGFLDDCLVNLKNILGFLDLSNICWGSLVLDYVCMDFSLESDNLGLSINIVKFLRTKRFFFWFLFFHFLARIQWSSKTLKEYN